MGLAVADALAVGLFEHLAVPVDFIEHFKVVAARGYTERAAVACRVDENIGLIVGPASSKVRKCKPPGIFNPRITPLRLNVRIPCMFRRPQGDVVVVRIGGGLAGCRGVVRGISSRLYKLFVGVVRSALARLVRISNEVERTRIV